MTMTQAQLPTTIMLSGNEPPRHFDTLIELASGRCWKMRQAAMAYVGRDPTNEVVTEDGTVSRLQAIVVRDIGGGWSITHMGRPPTYVNGVRIPLPPVFFVNGVRVTGKPVLVPLHLGAIVRAGMTVWVCADSQMAPNRWYICAQSEREFYRAALMLYGNLSRAAQGIGVKRTTFVGRLRKWAASGDQEAAKVLAAARAGKYLNRCTKVPMPVVIGTMQSIQARLASILPKNS